MAALPQRRWPLAIVALRRVSRHRAARTLVQVQRRRLDIRTVMVTHDWDEALTLLDRIAVLREGQILPKQLSRPCDG
jgi:ABC-type Fe3+/spermidine/putrescine transport system ATPase subunit